MRTSQLPGALLDRSTCLIQSALFPTASIQADQPSDREDFRETAVRGSQAGRSNACAAAQVASLGGTVAKAPFAVGDFATMALVTDPLGASFALWQPNQVQDTGDYKGIDGTEHGRDRRERRRGSGLT